MAEARRLNRASVRPFERLKRQEWKENPYGRNPKPLKSAVIVILENSPCFKPNYQSMVFSLLSIIFMNRTSAIAGSKNSALTHQLHA